MTKPKSAALALALLVLLGSSTRAVEGAKPPAFRLSSVVGGPVPGEWRIGDYLGTNPVVVLFFACWCGPCLQELPFYQGLYARYEKEGLKVVAISMDDANSISKAGPTTRRLGVKFPVLSDLDTRVAGQLNPRRSAPYSLWIDRGGRIAWAHEGFALAQRSSLEKGIAQLVAGQPVSMNVVEVDAEPARADP